MFRTIATAIDAADTRVAAAVASVGGGEPPLHDMFAAATHQGSSVELCVADRDTRENGNSRVAAAIGRNGQRIASHHWGMPALRSADGQDRA